MITLKLTICLPVTNIYKYFMLRGSNRSTIFFLSKVVLYTRAIYFPLNIKDYFFPISTSTTSAVILKSVYILFRLMHNHHRAIINHD